VPSPDIVSLLDKYAAEFYTEEELGRIIRFCQSVAISQIGFLNRYIGRRGPLALTTSDEALTYIARLFHPTKPGGPRLLAGSWLSIRAGTDNDPKAALYHLIRLISDTKDPRSGSCGEICAGRQIWTADATF
jgi:hypothetical protein